MRELAFVWVCFQNRKRKEENRAEGKKESMKTKSAESGVRCGSEWEAAGGKGEGRGLRGVLISNCAWCCVITPAKAWRTYLRTAKPARAARSLTYRHKAKTWTCLQSRQTEKHSTVPLTHPEPLHVQSQRNRQSGPSKDNNLATVCGDRRVFSSLSSAASFS